MTEETTDEILDDIRAIARYILSSDGGYDIADAIYLAEKIEELDEMLCNEAPLPEDWDYS